MPLRPRRLAAAADPAPRSARGALARVRCGLTPRVRSAADRMAAGYVPHLATLLAPPVAVDVGAPGRRRDRRRSAGRAGSRRVGLGVHRRSRRGVTAGMTGMKGAHGIILECALVRAGGQGRRRLRKAGTLSIRDRARRPGRLSPHASCEAVRVRTLRIPHKPRILGVRPIPGRIQLRCRSPSPGEPPHLS